MFIIQAIFLVVIIATTCVSAKIWPHGAKLRVRRVRAPTIPPLLINWGSISDIIDSPVNKDLDQDHEAAASELTFSGGYLAPPPDSDSDSSVEDPSLDYLPPPEENTDAALSCSIIEEVVYEDVTEEQCRTKSTTSCQQSPVQCTTAQETECNDYVETEYQQTCEDKTVNICEDVLQNQTQTLCNNIITEKCEDDYQTELKDECTYETVIEKVCSTGYSVSYNDQCRIVPQTQCKRGFGCRRVPRKFCSKVPKYPTKQCRNIPRVEGKCKKVPVKRPINKCFPVEREVCEEVPFQQVIKKCVYTNRPECKQTPVEVIKNACQQVEKEFCPEPEEICETFPTTICENVIVQKPRTVEREVCDDGISASSDTELTTSYQP